MEASPGTTEFLVEYAGAIAKQEKLTDKSQSIGSFDSVEWLFRQFFASPEDAIGASLDVLGPAHEKHLFVAVAVTLLRCTDRKAEKSGVFRETGDPYGIRTRVACVKGRCPRPD